MVDIVVGRDTLIIQDEPITDLFDGDVIVLNFPNDISTTTIGKNGNSIIAGNVEGRVAELEFRLLKGSEDDKFLNELLTSQKNDLPTSQLINSTIVKRIGDGNGNVSNETYSLEGGAFIKDIDYKENVSGDSEQAVAMWRVRFSRSTRTLG